MGSRLDQHWRPCDALRRVPFFWCVPQHATKCKLSSKKKLLTTAFYNLKVFMLYSWFVFFAKNLISTVFCTRKVIMLDSWFVFFASILLSTVFCTWKVFMLYGWFVFFASNLLSMVFCTRKLFMLYGWFLFLLHCVSLLTERSLFLPNWDIHCMKMSIWWICKKIISVW